MKTPKENATVVVKKPRTKRAPAPVEPAVEIVSSRTLAAYRARRTMIAKQMRGASKSVRTGLVAKLADYDRRLGNMKIAA